MPALLEAFALDQDYVAERRVVSDADFAFILSERETGRTAARFSIRVSSSDEGFADLLAEDTDIAMSLREVSADEVARGIEAHLGSLFFARTEPGDRS